MKAANGSTGFKTSWALSFNQFDCVQRATSVGSGLGLESGCNIVIAQGLYIIV